MVANLYWLLYAQTSLQCLLSLKVQGSSIQCS